VERRLAAGADAGVVTVTSLSNSNPAKCTVAAADLSKFQNGMSVVIAGATGTGMTAANGTITIANVGAGATTTFELVGVNTSAGAAAQTTGVDRRPAGRRAPGQGDGHRPARQALRQPQPVPYRAVAHEQLWFADTSNLALYYLPLQQKSGELKELPLNALFRRGGAIRAIYNWTIDGGAGIDDQLVIFSTNGEAVIFNGTDPDSADAWNLTGIFRFDSPLSMRSVIQYGGDLYVFVSTGLVPMSTMLRAESEQLGSPDKNVADLFVELTTNKDSTVAGRRCSTTITAGRSSTSRPARQRLPADGPLHAGSGLGDLVGRSRRAAGSGSISSCSAAPTTASSTS
jgi:hypothetical protein